MIDDDLPTPAVQARLLLRATRVGTLATAADGQPFASLATPACAPDLSVLLFLSELSEHTRHLHRDPRCAVMVSGDAISANPQTAPRVTVTGMAVIETDPAMKARWLAMHPYAALYAEFTDFALWRIRPEGGMLIGGFARAHRLRATELVPDAAAVAALIAAEADICRHCNDDHADTLALIAGGAGAWRMVGVDVDGCDLAQDDVVRRVAWGRQASDAADVRRELVTLTKVARLQAG